MPESQKGDNGLVVARGQAAVLLQAPEKPLDFVAVAVGVFVHRQGFGAVRVAGDDGLDAVLGAVGAGLVAVVGRVGEELARFETRQQGQRLRAVAGLPGGGAQAYGVAQRLDAGVDFGADAAAAATQTLGGGVTFFWPAAC